MTLRKLGILLMVAGSILSSCVSNTDVFAKPPKHIRVIAVSGAVVAHVKGIITKSQNQSFSNSPDRSNLPSTKYDTTIDRGTTTIDEIIDLSGNDVFDYDLRDSEVLTFSISLASASDSAKIELYDGGYKKTYVAKKGDVLGLMFSAGN